MVCLQHALHVLPEAYRSFFYRMGFGVIAVAVFFIISGFVIAEATSTFYARRPGAFMVNRMLRLIPPYIAALLLAALVQQWLYLQGRLDIWDGHLVGSPLQARVLLAGLFDIVPFFRPEYIGAQIIHFIPFAWSLRFEFAFYVFVFVVFVAANRFAGRRRERVLFGGMIGAYLLFAAYLVHGINSGRQLDSIPLFCLGIALYNWRMRHSWLNVLHVVFATAGAALAFALLDQHDNPTVAYQLPVLGVLCVIMWWLIFKVRTTGRSWGLDKFLGDLSYPLYLNHFIVLLALSNLTTSYGWFTYVIGVVVSLAVSVVMLRVVDVPMKGLRDRVRGVRLSTPGLEAKLA